MISVSYDPSDGIIRSCSRDFLTVAEVRRYQAELQSAIAVSRREWGDVRHIIDATEATVASPEVMDEFARTGNNVPEPSDRLAVLVATSLTKMQTKRNLLTDRENVFLSPDAALMWLMAMPRAGGAPAPSGAPR